MKLCTCKRPCQTLPAPAVAASDLMALLVVDRHHRTAAALAVHLYDLPDAAEQVRGATARIGAHKAPFVQLDWYQTQLQQSQCKQDSACMQGWQLAADSRAHTVAVDGLPCKS